MKSIFDWCVPFFLIVGVGAVPGAAQPESANDKLDVPPSYSISKKTTFVTGPLTDNGRINFVEAVNQEFQAGIDKAENAAVDIIPLLGFGILNGMPDHKKALFERLNIPNSKLTTDQFTDFKTFAAEHNFTEKRFKDLLANTRKTVWRKKTFPVVGAYIHQHNHLLNKVVGASAKPAFYTPLIAHRSDQLLLEVSLPYAQEIRTLQDVLVARALLNLGEGRLDLAWRDIIAAKRLSQHMGKQPTLIEGLVSNAMMSSACDAARQFVRHAGPLGEVDWGACLDQWTAQSYQIANLARQVKYAERLTLIQAISQLIDGQIEPNDASRGGKLELMEQITDSGKIEWDEGLRWVNTFYDRVLANLKIQNPEKRDQAFHELYEKLRRTQTRVDSASWARPGIVETSAEERGKTICAIFLIYMAPGMIQVVDAESNSRDSQKVVALALAMRYVQQNNKDGAMPDELEDLRGVLDSNHFTHSTSGRPLRFARKGGHVLIGHQGPNRKWEVWDVDEENTASSDDFVIKLDD